MNFRTYVRAIVPIGVFYSGSLICSNQAYLYLSVAFIQMLKVTKIHSQPAISCHCKPPRYTTTLMLIIASPPNQASAPAAVLLVSWLLGVAKPSLVVLLNVVVIVLGVMIASYDEVQFVWRGFMYQAGGILAEASRLVMIQILLSGDGQNSMDPLVSLYYYAPVCAAMNFLVALITEWSSLQMAAVWNVGVLVLVLNAAVAFMLNVASVLLVRTGLLPGIHLLP